MTPPKEYRSIMSMEAAWRLYQSLPERLGPNSTFEDIAQKLEGWTMEELYLMTHAVAGIHEQADAVMMALMAELQRRGIGDVIIHLHDQAPR